VPLLVVMKYKIESTQKTSKTKKELFWASFHLFQSADTQASPNLKK